MENGSVHAEKLVSLIRTTLTTTQLVQLDACTSNSDRLDLINQFELVGHLSLDERRDETGGALTPSPEVVEQHVPLPTTRPVEKIVFDDEDSKSETNPSVPPSGEWVAHETLAQLRKDAEQNETLTLSLQQCQESGRQKDQELERMQSRLAKAQLQPTADQLAHRLAPLLSNQLDLPQLTQQAINQAVALAADSSLQKLLDQTHQRIDQAHGPAIVTRRWLFRLQWGFYGSLILIGLLTGLLVLSHHRAFYYSEGFYKYETVRYRALLPGYQAYNSVYREVEDLWVKPDFMDRLAGIESLYNRIGKPERQAGPQQGGKEQTANTEAKKVGVKGKVKSVKTD